MRVADDEIDVIVVGAGFAGLAAARALSRVWLRVVVLEARDRVGGRAHTRVVDGGPWVDLGGQWIGPTQREVLALANELEIETFPTFTEGDNLVVAEGKKRRYRGLVPRVSPLALLDFGVARWRLDRMAKEVPLDAPWKAPRAEEWDSTSLGDWLDANLKTKTARRLFEAALETVYAAPARELSLLHALFYVRSGGDLDMLLGTERGAQATRVSGGMQGFAEKAAASLDVRLSCPVKRIEQDEEGVTVSFDAGGARRSLRASEVIVAIPPGLVADVAFAPALPPERAELVARMPMGAVIKHTAIYDRPFWRDDGLSGMVLSDEGPIHVVFDNSLPDAKSGILMGFSEAKNARRLGALTEDERRAEAVACFARYFGDRARRPIAYADHVWEHDPWSGGCYGAFMPPGVWTELGPALREPHGRVHWAGTETATAWSGYVDGAISSGLRAANEIARHRASHARPHSLSARRG
ncbi:MAG: flavin monoamine oxidase family protein [Labilithrix sp.]|nr:flavin monoamine oxidase family protein [Labilithrix sp.]